MSEDKKSDYTEVHEEPRRMSEEDVKDYHGLTLNEQGEEYRKEAPQGGIHIEFIDVKAIPWWKKALYIAGIIAFLAIVLAVAWFFLVWVRCHLPRRRHRVFLEKISVLKGSRLLVGRRDLFAWRKMLSASDIPPKMNVIFS